MKLIILLIALFAFSCCAPIESDGNYSSTVEEPVVEKKNPIDLEIIYHYYDEYETETSYIEMYRFKLKGMEYVHVQEDNGDGYGYVINLTKDSLMCAQMISRRPIKTHTNSIDVSSDVSGNNEEWDYSN